MTEVTALETTWTTPVDPQFDLSSGTTSHGPRVEHRLDVDELSFVLPSTSRLGAMGNWTEIWLASRTTSRSRTSIFEILSDRIRAEFRSSSVSVDDTTENVYELRRLTGLSWIDLADLLNVDRRTLHNWIKGRNVSRRNARHIAETLALMKYVDRGSSDENASAIFRRSVLGRTAFEEVKRGQYDEVRRSLSYGNGRTELTTPGTSFAGDFIPILTHQGAEELGRVTALPSEPRPRSRTRDIRRG